MDPTLYWLISSISLIETGKGDEDDDDDDDDDGRDDDEKDDSIFSVANCLFLNSFLIFDNKLISNFFQLKCEESK